jgi:hypothetical protein
VTIEVRQTALAYEAYLDEQRVGTLSMSRHGDVITAIHTEVDPDAEGKGVGSELARTLFDDARAAGRQVDVECKFVASWVKRHPEYQDLVVTPAVGRERT